MAENMSYKNATVTDDKGRVLKESREEKATDQGKLMWWKPGLSPEDRGQAILASINFMQQHNVAHAEQLTVSTRLYGNSSAFSFLGNSFTRSASMSSSASSQRISFNLCSSIVDTFTAQMAKNKITPTFITSGGRWGLQKKAENLSKFIDGCFYENGVHEKTVDACRDGAAWGDGIVHIFRTDEDRVGIERVLPHELVIDEVESIVAKPTQMHRVRVVDRQLVIEMCKDIKGAEEKINAAMPSAVNEIAGAQTAGDLITISASWRLSTTKSSKDGYYCLTVGDQVIDEEVYTKTYFPFAFYQYAKRLLGFWGQGAVERVQKLQGEINRLMMLIQKSMWLGGSFKILLPIGSKVVTQHLNNDVGAIIHYAGDVPPQYVTPPMIQQDIYPYVDTLIERGFRQEGISMLSASNVKPLGVNSGTALRTYDKIGDDRQLVQGQQVEEFSLEIARQMIEVIKDIFKDKKSYKVTWPGTKFVESIDWKDVDLQEDEYYLKAFPTSSFPEEPMARLETIQEYMQAGMISPRAGRRLLRTEDIEMSDLLASAQEELICKTIEGILYDTDAGLRPDGNWDLQLAKQLSLEYYNYALLNNCPQKNMDLLRDFQGYVDEEMGLTTPPPPPSPGMGMANDPTAPMAQPMATPQSNMIPNTATAVGG